MKNDSRYHINQIDDLTVELAVLRLSDSRDSKIFRIVDTLNQLQKHNYALGCPVPARRMVPIKTISYEADQNDRSGLNFTQYGMMAGGYIALGYYAQVGLRNLITRLFGRPAS